MHFVHELPKLKKALPLGGKFFFLLNLLYDIRMMVKRFVINPSWHGWYFFDYFRFRTENESLSRLGLAVTFGD